MENGDLSYTTRSLVICIPLLVLSRIITTVQHAVSNYKVGVFYLEAGNFCNALPKHVVSRTVVTEHCENSSTIPGCQVAEATNFVRRFLKFLGQLSGA
jgi:hypothetical protein